MKNVAENLKVTENFFEVVKRRRAIRRYKDYDIPKEDLKKIFQAARLAPSAENSQPWYFIVVKKRETKKLLARPSPQTFIADANAVVVVLGDPTVSCCSRATWTTRDPMIAAEHLVLAATALGYGTCWIANYESRPKEWIDEVKRTLKIPEHMSIVVLVAIGVPDENPSPRPRKSLRDICFVEEYGAPLFPSNPKQPGQASVVTNMVKEEVKEFVKKRYSEIAKKRHSSCCCGSSPADAALQIGYSNQDLQDIPEASIMGLGCGNPVALASLREGETVLDLGSGGGIDVFLAAKKVGPEGNIIGVDMTEDMISKAKATASKYGYKNVEFRLGEIENLPVQDNSVDVVISNCVINLSPDKGKVFREAYRVLKPGGRIMISDLVTEGELPKEIMNSFEAWAGCVAGALEKSEYLETIRRAGFKSVSIISETTWQENISQELKGKITSVQVEAYKR